MKLDKQLFELTDDLNLSPAEAYIIELKSELYDKCAEAISNSPMTHLEISKQVGTSRARISRLSNFGENSVSVELLIKVIAVIEKRSPIKIVA